MLKPHIDKIMNDKEMSAKMAQMFKRATHHALQNQMQRGGMTSKSIDIKPTQHMETVVSDTATVRASIDYDDPFAGQRNKLQDLLKKPEQN
jgi:hypothetical protein